MTIRCPLGENTRGACGAPRRADGRVLFCDVTVREGRMDVRIINDSGLSGAALHQRIADAVAEVLAESGERLLGLTGEHWTGFAEGPTSPWMVYRNVGYTAVREAPGDA